ncbi:MAG: DNA-processing protein DprA [Prevotella sp.]|nr:DNA-processing protein DprA [Prevotella sp.]
MDSSTKETIAMMALTRVGYYNLTGILDFYKHAGSATAIIDHRKDVREVIPDASPKLVERIRDCEAHIHRAEEEYEWTQQHGVRILRWGDDAYPQRLAECADAPLILYYKGTADLNQMRVINIVGTRHCTIYGQDIVRHFIDGLREICGNRMLVVSGLAYGVDIAAHRNALEKGFETVGVLAHGLDDLYPPRHRETAKRMLTQGGLLTEYMTRTNADKMNFVRRNRIVAGMCDATVLVESAAHGGGLITCGIAQEYGREVFAFPGNINQEYSEGCNNLIRKNGATLITSAKDFAESMGWLDDRRLERAQKEGIERQMFPDLSPDQQRIVETLQKTNDLQVNMLSNMTGLSVGKVAAEMFELEMKGVARSLPGSVCHLL